MVFFYFNILEDTILPLIMPNDNNPTNRMSGMVVHNNYVERENGWLVCYHQLWLGQS